MKYKMLLIIVLGVILLESCTKAMTPFEAAHNPRGKKCAVIR